MSTCSVYMYNKFKDRMCCGMGEGSYEVTLGGNVCSVLVEGWRDGGSIILPWWGRTGGPDS